MASLHSPSSVDASSIIGARVLNPGGELLGVINEVTIDSRDGRIAYSVVSFGGFFSMGEQRFAIPFAAFDYNVTKNEYMFDVTKARLEAVPGVQAKWVWAKASSAQHG